MTEFKSWQSFDAFRRAALSQYRYLRDPEHDSFLETVVETAKSREISLKNGQTLWRAQRGHEWRNERQGDAQFAVPAAFSPKRMKPLRNQGPEGRANPKGIPFLYLASRQRTALSEVRPWIGTYVSVAQFKLKRAQRIVDCSRNTSGGVFYFEEPDAAEREKAVWSAIDQAFAEPVEESEGGAEYVPTQILAELFRKRGYDGIAYRSNFGDGELPGYNIVLFDLSAADLVNCALHRVKSVRCDFSQMDNTYFVRRFAQARARSTSKGRRPRGRPKVQ